MRFLFSITILCLLAIAACKKNTYPETINKGTPPPYVQSEEVYFLKKHAASIQRIRNWKHDRFMDFGDTSSKDYPHATYNDTSFGFQMANDSTICELGNGSVRINDSCFISETSLGYGHASPPYILRFTYNFITDQISFHKADLFGSGNYLGSRFRSY